MKFSNLLLALSFASLGCGISYAESTVKRPATSVNPPFSRHFEEGGDPYNRFDDARIDYENAKEAAPTIKELKGTWQLVLFQNDPGVDAQNLLFDNGYDFYMTPAEAAQDRNDPHALFGLNFSESETGKEIQANLSGLGMFSQGPNDVSFEGQDACFNQYAFESIGDPQVEDKAYGTLRCRFVNKNRTSLLCSKTPYGNGWTDRQKPWIGKTIEYLGYTKLR